MTMMKEKIEETKTEADQALSQAQERLEEKQTVANGRFTQAKGFAKEKWGQITHNDALQRAGKAEQAKGYLQANYGNHWVVRNKGTVIAITAIVGALIYFFVRKNTAA